MTDTPGFQPHGVVLVVGATDHRVRAASESAEAVLGRTAEQLVGGPLTAFLDDRSASIVAGALAAGEFGWQRIALIDGARAKAHVFEPAEGVLAVDLVVLGSIPTGSDAEAVERIAAWSERLLQTTTPAELLQVASTAATALSGFDGAWACRREPSGHGTVVAAEVTGSGDVVGQAVLESDMPPAQPARGRQLLPFFVADLAASATRLTPAPEPAWCFDQSALLRRYEPYLERLASIGVGATFSLPLTVGRELWGRVIAHHPVALPLLPATQAELRLLGVTASTHLTELLTLADTRERLELSTTTTRLITHVRHAPDSFEGLVAEPAALLGICNAGSAVVALEGRTQVVGAPLDPEVADAVLALARRQLSGEQEAVYATDDVGSLGVDIPEVGGILATRFNDDATNLVVWIRPDSDAAVTWVDHVVVGDDTPDVLFADVAPRLEQHRGTSAPWTAGEQQAVVELRTELSAVALAAVQRLEQRNADLARSNAEFDAFAHTAAHDLKQPIRGIRQFAEFVLEDAHDVLAEPQRADLRTVVRLGERMHGLLEDLMSYAQLGGTEHGAPVPLDLAEAVREAVELIAPDLREEATFDVQGGMLKAEPSGLQHLLLNLIGNAIKFAGGPVRVTVGLTTLGEASGHASPPATLRHHHPGSVVLEVADDGPGIGVDYHEHVFGLFRTLNADPTNPTAGTGAGLALCRRVAQRHGGDIWVASTPGEGATFFALLG